MTQLLLICITHPEVHRQTSVNHQSNCPVNNKISIENSDGIFRIIKSLGKFGFSDFENNKSPPQAKQIKAILGVYQSGNGKFV